MEDQFSIPLQYEMNEEETQAYQLALLWSKKVVEYFPEARIGPGNKLRATGDPRDSSLFKYMIRMIRRTRGLVAPTELKHYMMAQLWICKVNNDQGEAYVSPQMTAGDAAWKRWKVYEKMMKKVKESRQATETEEDQNVSMETVDYDLKTSAAYLAKYVPEVTPQFLEQRQEKGDIAKWLKFGFIRPYFVALSPTLRRLEAPVITLAGLKNEKVRAAYASYFPKDRA